MILKEFGKAKSFANYTAGEITQIDSPQLVLPINYDGFYQYHEIGTVIFAFKIENPYFLIEERKFIFSEIQSVNYNIDGCKREFVIHTNNENHFYYETFWINEVNMIEFALGYPDDDENDLIKVVFNRINSFLLEKL